MNGRYHILYTATPQPKGLPREEIPPGNGACDCIVVHSIIGVPGSAGPLSVAVVSLNGTDGSELTPEQQFTVWSLWADSLAKRLPEGGRKLLAQAVIDSVRDAVHAARESGDG